MMHGMRLNTNSNMSGKRIKRDGLMVLMKRGELRTERKMVKMGLERKGWMERKIME